MSVSLIKIRLHSSVEQLQYINEIPLQTQNGAAYHWVSPHPFSIRPLWALESNVAIVQSTAFILLIKITLVCIKTKMLQLISQRPKPHVFTDCVSKFWTPGVKRAPFPIPCRLQGIRAVRAHTLSHSADSLFICDPSKKQYQCGLENRRVKRSKYKII
jgi:hypothetical protein